MSLRQEYSYLLLAKIENNKNHLCLIHNYLVAIKLLLINPCAQDYSVNWDVSWYYKHFHLRGKNFCKF